MGLGVVQLCCAALCQRSQLTWTVRAPSRMPPLRKRKSAGSRSLSEYGIHQRARASAAAGALAQAEAEPAMAVVVEPEPAETTAAAPPTPTPSEKLDLSDTTSLIHTILVGLFARLPEDGLLTFHDTLARLSSACKVAGHAGVTIASACSGSGCPEFWMGRVSAELPQVSFDVFFQCEATASKRRWLDVFSPGVNVMFKDVEVLKQMSAVNMKLPLQTRVPVLPAVLFVCGFSCQSVSVIA